MALKVEALEWWHARAFGVARLRGEAIGYTFFDDDGRVAAIALAAPITEHEAFVSLAGQARPLMLRWAKRLLDDLAHGGFRRALATVDHDIDGAEEFMRRLGFQPGEDGVYVCELDSDGALIGR